MPSKKTVREEYIFKGSYEDFKRFLQGDELYELFQSQNIHQIPPTPNPFLPPVEHIGLFADGNYNGAYKAESFNTTRIIIEGEGKLSWFKEWKSDMEQQGLISQVFPKNELASIQKLIPKKPETLQHYKHAWQIWLEMIDEYQLDVLDGRSKKSKPTMEDFRARVIYELGWEVGERTLHIVKRLGNAGELD